MALDVTIEDSQILAMAELRKLLTTVPNLLKLSMEIIAHNHPWESGRLKLLDSLAGAHWQLPRLKYLRLQGAGLKLANYNWHGWENCVQWECLEYLESSDTAFFAFFLPPLKALRSLTLSRSADGVEVDENAVLELLYSLPNLEHLSAFGLTSQVTMSDYLERKGSSLKTLRLHETSKCNSRDDFRQEPVEGNVQRFGKTCPSLKTCAIYLRVQESVWVSTMTTPKLSKETNSLTKSFIP